MNEQEANDIFFCLTQLFTKRDVIVKRLLHILIKELSSLSNDAIIATSSLIKDINIDELFYKPSALRALVNVTDKAMIGSIERYLKQAIVHNYGTYASSALVSAYRINSSELLKKWTSEITQALESNNSMVEYHAFGVAYLMRKDDKFAIIKMMSKYGKSLNSPITKIFMIRVCSLMLTSLLNQSNLKSTVDINLSDDFKTLFGFLSFCLNTRNDMVALESCRACISLKSLPNKIVQQILNIFKMQTNSYKSYVRYSAIRSLYDMINNHPYLLEIISKEMKDQIEFLTTDENTNICMYAVIISLKLSSENNIKKVLKMSSKLMKELSDEFRIEIVKQMAIIAIKFPEHCDTLLSTLDVCLRNEGGYEFKNAVVNSIVILLKKNPLVNKLALHSLCEFLEDCEYKNLSIKIIKHIGIFAKSSENPISCVRYIFNRILLEKAEIRLAAVRCLARMGCSININKNNQLNKNDIIVLLQRCMGDSEDNIRMEADMYSRILQCEHSEFINSYLCPNQTPNIDIKQLKFAFSTYLKNNNFENACDITNYKISQDQDLDNKNSKSIKFEKAIKEETTFTEIQNNQTSFDDELTILENTNQKLSMIPIIQNLGSLLSMSSKPFNLTEIESEYFVNAMKYVYQNHIVIEFSIKNTVNDYILDSVTFEFTPPDEFIIESFTVSKQIKNEEKGNVYFVLKLPMDPLNIIGDCTNCVMKFTVIDSANNASFADQYDIEDIPIVVGDYITAIETFSFETEWNTLGSEHELNDAFLLSTFSSIDTATESVLNILSMNVVSDNYISQDNKSQSSNKRVIKLFGSFKMNTQVAAILEFSQFPNIRGITLNAFFRTNDPVASEILVGELYG